MMVLKIFQQNKKFILEKVAKEFLVCIKVKIHFWYARVKRVLSLLSQKPEKASCNKVGE